jgi:hypothetical protein
MREEYPADPYDAPPHDDPRRFPPLPPWLVRKVLREGEKVTWVRAPRFTPAVERYITHPLLALAAVAFGVVCVAVSLMLSGVWQGAPLVGFLAAIAAVVGSIIVLGLSNGYFTRLVVTTRRILILQGYEVCRKWNVDDLPPSLTRYGTREDGEEGRTVDLGAMNAMLGAHPEGFVDPKTILAFGKRLDRLRDEDRGRH